ncbi:NF-kappa-B inhibitor-like protein 1 [Pholidichthys leucotaenia]
MATNRRQARVWRYVEAGDLKLKSYLRKHSNLDVNFSWGRKQRSPLHLACSLGNDTMVRLLLKHGAQVARGDRRGDTALHTAANRALKYGKTGEEDRVYDFLVVPLKRHCPEALNIPNKAGVTPQQLLDLMKGPQTSGTGRWTSDLDDDEWMEKLFNECEDEFYETFGVYDADDFLPVDDDDEDFGDWADRIREEYYAKKRTEATSFCHRRSKQAREDREQLHREHKRLQKEHEEYLARAERKEEETRRGKKRHYDERCKATFHSGGSASAKKLSFNDIPWPAPKGTIQDMIDVMLHGVDRGDTAAFRKAIRKQQVLWHPDKFAQRCEAQLEEVDKQQILDTVTALSQELNRLAQRVKV